MKIGDKVKLKELNSLFPEKYYILMEFGYFSFVKDENVSQVRVNMTGLSTEYGWWLPLKIVCKVNKFEDKIKFVKELINE